ncbi:MAG: hypothetical protein JWP13_177 [Candidatus Saccharibacteria bacterium]|nr:hypothetical protein [Candidatus Saccharibacteria bacterium]
MQMKFTKEKTRTNNVYAFIDSQNLNVGTQKFGWKMDWQKFRKYLTDKYGVTKAFMFIGYVPEFEPLYEQLHDAGYMIVLKPTYDMTKPQPDPNAPEAKEKPEEEKKPVKGNIDADLVLWAMKEMSNYDQMILVSGDGDFYSLVEYMESKKRLHKILTPSFQYSQLFNRYEEYIVRLDQSKKELRYFDRKRK